MERRPRTRFQVTPNHVAQNTNNVNPALRPNAIDAAEAKNRHQVNPYPVTVLLSCGARQSDVV